MKKIIIFLILGLGMMVSCTEDDPEPQKSYSMPYLTSDKTELKNHLLEITPNVVETQVGNTFTIVCKPAPSETNMFSEMIYTINYKGFELDEFTFSYKIDKSITLTEDEKVKLDDFLKNSTVNL